MERKKMFVTTLSTPMGIFQAYADECGLHKLLFPGHSREKHPSGSRQIDKNDQPIFKELAEQLNQYMWGKRQTFSLLLAPQGTPFQQLVWKLLCEIPYGETRSYGKLAEKLGSKNKARAVGGAAHANPLPIIIPCHRLIGANGKLTGFAGGLTMKKQLLELETSVLRNTIANENQTNNR
jgi:methylated-DNA-[protein]-cysteine S-methyltransferase